MEFCGVSKRSDMIYKRNEPVFLKFQTVFCVVILQLLFIGGYGCSSEKPEILQRNVDDERAEEKASTVLDELSYSIDENLSLQLWASEDLLGDPVSLHMDDSGRAWVTNTHRRRNAEIDIRGLPQWMVESVRMQTLEDRRDFLKEELAPERSEENQWLSDFNDDGSRDWRDLTAIREAAFLVEDTSRNGYANRATRFIHDFNNEVTDVAGAILFHQGDLFLGVAPDLWRIRDLDGDGYGEEKESISHGYAVNIGFGGHGMSGLTTGPDGRIYWSIGDRGISVTGPDGKKWHYPREGVIVRSEPDGTDFEVVASGLRNTHEFVFDKYGNLITVDNDGDHAGEEERLVYLINGSDSGWRQNWQFGKYDDPKNNSYHVLMDEEYFKPRFDDQAAHILPPLANFHNGPSGMAYQPGTALDGRWQDHFFLSHFVGSASNSNIRAFSLKPSGASFELDTDQEIFSGLLATSLDFGPDGALYFTDWVEGWAPNQQGRIWKVDALSEEKSSKSDETEQLLANSFDEIENTRLGDLLAHEDMRVRKKAQFELAARDDHETLLNAAAGDHQLARIHGIWGLGQISRQNADTAELLLRFLDDEDPEIRTQTAKILGDIRLDEAADPIVELLEDEHPRVVLYATEALGRIGSGESFDAIVAMLERYRDEEVYLRHAGAIALERIGDTTALTNLSGHSSEAVRTVAVIALKRLESPGVIQFLDDENEYIVTNAARAINDDTFIEEGLKPLAAMLKQQQFSNEPLIRRAINANLYDSSPENAHRLAEFADRNDVSPELRAEALKTLSVWEESSKLDRVTGDPRDVVKKDPEDARAALNPVLVSLLNGSSADVQIAALDAVRSLRHQEALDLVVELYNRDTTAEVRIKALDVLAELSFEKIEDVIFAALEDESPRVRMSAVRWIPELELPEDAATTLIKTVLETGSVEERREALAILGQHFGESGRQLLNEQMEDLLTDELDPELHLDLIEASEEAELEDLKPRLASYRSGTSYSDSVAAYRETLYGGDPEKGRQIFYQNNAAQCIRCHAVDGEGSGVGPELTDVGQRLNREKLLESMVHPDADIPPGYGSVRLVLESGQTVRGVLVAESETRVTVENRDGEQSIRRSDIRERTNSPSGMPAKGDILSRSELRDLVEFMITLK